VGSAGQGIQHGSGFYLFLTRSTGLFTGGIDNSWQNSGQHLLCHERPSIPCPDPHLLRHQRSLCLVLRITLTIQHPMEIIIIGLLLSGYLLVAMLYPEKF
jgi:K+-transporting ATPase KdpF subunit